MQKPSPHNTNYTDILQINATVTDISGVKQVTLMYTTDSVTWKNETMTLIGTNLYSGMVGPFVKDATVAYKIMVEDVIGNVSNSSSYGFVVVPESPSSLILSLFMIATLLAVLVYKRRAEALSRRKERARL